MKFKYKNIIQVIINFQPQELFYNLFLKIERPGSADSGKRMYRRLSQEKHIREVSSISLLFIVLHLFVI